MFCNDFEVFKAMWIVRREARMHWVLSIVGWSLRIRLDWWESLSPNQPHSMMEGKMPGRKSENLCHVAAAGWYHRMIIKKYRPNTSSFYENWERESSCHSVSHHEEGYIYFLSPKHIFTSITSAIGPSSSRLATSGRFWWWILIPTAREDKKSDIAAMFVVCNFCGMGLLQPNIAQ